MIKLTDLLEAVYTDKPESPDEDLMQQGFKLGKPEIDPETGTSSTIVTYLPKFEQIRKDIIKMRKEFQPFRFSQNEDVAGLAKDINTNLTKLSQMIFAIDKMIELQRKSR
jgi:hypothetical protein